MDSDWIILIDVQCSRFDSIRYNTLSECCWSVWHYHGYHPVWPRCLAPRRRGSHDVLGRGSDGNGLWFGPTLSEPPHVPSCGLTACDFFSMFGVLCWQQAVDSYIFSCWISYFKLNLIHLIFNVNGQSNPTFIGYHSATQEYRPEHVSGQLEERIAPSALSDCISMRAQMIRLAEQRIKEVTSYFGGFWSRVYIY